MSQSSSNIRLIQRDARCSAVSWSRSLDQDPEGRSSALAAYEVVLLARQSDGEMRHKLGMTLFALKLDSALACSSDGQRDSSSSLEIHKT